METPIEQKPALNLAWTERTMCSALEDMRKFTNRFEVLTMSIVEDEHDKETLLKPLYVIYSLIEEIQVYGSRMETALTDFKEDRDTKEKYKKLKKEIEELEDKKKALEKIFPKEN